MEDPRPVATYRTTATNRRSRGYESGHREGDQEAAAANGQNGRARRLYPSDEGHEPPIGHKRVEKQCEECGFGFDPSARWRIGNWPVDLQTLPGTARGRHPAEDVLIETHSA